MRTAGHLNAEMNPTLLTGGSADSVKSWFSPRGVGQFCVEYGTAVEFVSL